MIEKLIVSEQDANCPCQSGKPYVDCCSKFHEGGIAQTAPDLMRSRYSAFVLQLYPYLIETHHVDYRGTITSNDLQASQPEQWLGLDIENAIEHGDSASVTFKAWFKDDGMVSAIYEKSAFINEQGRWFYASGEQFEVRLPKMNAPCICKSGKKFKRCCNTN